MLTFQMINQWLMNIDYPVVNGGSASERARGIQIPGLKMGSQEY